MWLYGLATAAVIAVVSAILWAAARQKAINGSRPTLPGGHWLWGHARFFAPIETLHERLIALARNGPRAVWLRIGPAGPLGADVVVLNDATLATALLRMGGNRAEQDPAAVDDIARVIGTGLISTRGDVWSRRRTVISGHFLSPPALRDYAPGMAVDAARMAAALVAKASEDGAVGVSSSHDMMLDWLMPYVLGVSLRLTCGDLPTDLDLRAFMHDLDTVFGEFNVRSFKPCNSLRPTTAAHKAALTRVRRTIGTVVAQTRQRSESAGDDDAGSGGGSRPTLAAILLDKGADVYKTNDAVRDETLLVTFGAYETTAATAAYTLHLLATHPDVQARVRDEVRAATLEAPGRLGAGTVTPLLDACVSESMRLYPAAFAVSRRAEVDLRIEAPATPADPTPCVVDVPAGTRVLINGIGISRSPRHWADPDVFRPERWLAGTDKCARVTCGSLPFGGGPRACPGNKLALLEIRTVIAALVDAVEFAPDPARPFTCAVRFMLRPDGPHLLCKPVARADTMPTVE
ncbi:Cytochrome P450 domain containing protein [Pandoravirus celtis]|uniref:Cytochrome P450 domain containing protein n=1 Tax=Pandoravirus celtis TaxID=2568002 RepID=A0A4D6EHX0_9VIRU|nr:Cytochrome P450 domain containing protein [Pandoravirus celtis]